MRTFNRDAFKQGIYIRKTQGNRIFEFVPTNSKLVNRQFHQLYIAYYPLLTIHSLRDLNDTIFNLMANLVEKSFLNLKPDNLHAIDIIDTYCQESDPTIIYLYDKDENYLGKIITCAPKNMVNQVINSRCKQAEYWSSEPFEETKFNTIYKPKLTKL